MSIFFNLLCSKIGSFSVSLPPGEKKKSRFLIKVPTKKELSHFVGISATLTVLSTVNRLVENTGHGTALSSGDSSEINSLSILRSTLIPQRLKLKTLPTTALTITSPVVTPCL